MEQNFMNTGLPSSSPYMIASHNPSAPDYFGTQADQPWYPQAVGLYASMPETPSTPSEMSTADANHHDNVDDHHPTSSDME